MLKRKYRAIISILLCFSLIFGSSASVYSSSFLNDGTKIQATEETAKVRFPFTFIFEDSSILSGLIGLVWYGTKVTIKGYDGNFTEIALNDSIETGYILSFCHGESSAKLLVRYANIFMDQTRNILKDYDNPQDFSWSVSQDGIISIDKNTGVVTPINPGTVVVTAKYNGKSSKCVVSAINRWENQETAKAKKDVVLKSSPANSNYTVYDVITVSKDTEIIAVGDTAQANGQIYVKIKNGDGYKYGHIKLSDFPGIDYIMTQYHYYDQGYNLRFSSASSKIGDYASVLDDVMMANFGLKVCYYIKPYTSVADECKIMIDGKVSSSNLSTACPQTSGHYSGTCLTSDNVRSDLRKQFGGGGGSVSKAVWIGHKMTDNERSNAIVGKGDIVMTPYGTIDKTSAKIREDRIYTLVHETSHQFGVYDHYCADDKKDDNSVCSNKHCSECNGEPIPYGCIMLDRENIENTPYTALYCDDCIRNISNSIKNF